MNTITHEMSLHISVLNAVINEIERNSRKLDAARNEEIRDLIFQRRHDLFPYDSPFGVIYARSQGEAKSIAMKQPGCYGEPEVQPLTYIIA